MKRPGFNSSLHRAALSRGEQTPTSHQILNQLATDFDELGRRMQKAIDTRAADDPQTDRLRRVRDKAFDAAVLSRQAAIAKMKQ